MQPALAVRARLLRAASIVLAAVLALSGVAGGPDPQAVESFCPGAPAARADVLLCEDFDDGAALTRWDVGSNRSTWPDQQFVLCTDDRFGFRDRCAAWSNHLVFDGEWGFWGYDAWRAFSPQQELYVRWYQYISNPFAWGGLEDKSVMIHDAANRVTAYVATNRDERPDQRNSGPGMPFVANYQDIDWPESGGQYTKVNRFQNQGQNITLQPGRWYLFEWYVKLNTPGASNGTTSLWIDDATQPVAQQTLRMQYTDMRWLRSSDAGRPFSFLRLTVYHQRCDGRPNTCPPNGPSVLEQSHRWDHIVVSRSRIGPLAAAAARPAPPAPSNPRIVR